MNEIGNDEVVRQLDRIARLLVLVATKGEIQRSQIEMLSGVGFLPKEIAELLGTTPNTVSVALVHIRKSANTGEPKQPG